MSPLAARASLAVANLFPGPVSEEQLIAAINRMPRTEFVALLGGIFEHSPWVAHAAWAQRPFDSIADVHKKMYAVVRSATVEQQLSLLCAHPQLAGTAAQRDELTDSSRNEQRGAGLTQLNGVEMQRIAQLNQSYAARFGFPFIIAVRNHDKAGIFAEFERRIDNTKQDEIDTALDQVSLIAQFRLQDLAIHFSPG